jgi:hypothetical protein
VAVLVPRLVLGLADDWGDTEVELPVRDDAAAAAAGAVDGAADGAVDGAGGGAVYLGGAGEPDAAASPGGADDRADPAGGGAPGAWWNELTGEQVGAGWCRLADLLARFPVALLARLDGSRDR